MSLGVYRETYSENQVYRYRITDEADQVQYLAEPTGATLPNPTRLVTLFDADHVAVGRLEPSPVSPWRLCGEYTLVLEGREEPLAVIEERWNLVDLILLRLPRYVLHLEGSSYVARGSRYRERLYEIFPYSPEEEQESLGRALESLEEALVESGQVEAQAEEREEAQLRRALEEVVQSWGEPLGAIVRPVRGPNYVVEMGAPALEEAPLVLAALVVIVDAHLRENGP